MKTKKLLSALMLVGGVAALSQAWVAGGTTGSGASGQNPAHQVGMRFRQVMIQIHKAQDSKTLTAGQAKALRTQVMAVKKQEVADMKQNGNRTLTESQVSQLNGQLDTLSKSIP